MAATLITTPWLHINNYVAFVFCLAVLKKFCCGGQNNDVHALRPGGCEYVTLPGKRDFGDVIKVNGLKMERFS